MGPNESFDVAGPAGRLEALLMLPEGEPAATAVLCHAHPLHGGMMHFKVVFRAAKALQQQGLAVLRFNFRGVGRSEGEHDQGRGEQDDARAAMDALEKRLPGRPLVLGGFSFGAAVASWVGAKDSRVRALVALGFPFRLVTDVSFLAEVRTPRLFVQGENDEFGGEAPIRALVESLPEPKKLVVIEGSDHYFTGHLDALQREIALWAAPRPWVAS
jgi:alpha/beta superfamily hydrolase